LAFFSAALRAEEHKKGDRVRSKEEEGEGKRTDAFSAAAFSSAAFLEAAAEAASSEAFLSAAL
jgi:hypothetical protein